MIANSEIVEDGIILSHPVLVDPAGFLKNQLSPLPYQFFGNFIVPSEKGAGG